MSGSVDRRYIAHAERISRLCDWILAARTTQAAVGRFESASLSAATSAQDIQRMRVARRLAVSIITNQRIRVAGSKAKTHANPL